MGRLTEAKTGFRSLTEAIDTTTPAGRMMMQMAGAFAEFEWAMLRERTTAGLDFRPLSVGSFVKPFSFFCSPFPRIRVLAIQVLPGNSRCLYSEEFPGRWEF
jgi:hypothetical protein